MSNDSGNDEGRPAKAEPKAPESEAPAQWSAVNVVSSASWSAAVISVISPEGSSSLVCQEMETAHSSTIFWSIIRKQENGKSGNLKDSRSEMHLSNSSNWTF